VLTWALPSSKAVDAQPGISTDGLTDLQDKLKALEGLLRHVTVVTTQDGLKEIVITRANLRIVNGLGSTDCTNQGQEIPNCPNGLGNLIVGYNEPRSPLGGPNVRTGSHNVVVGQFNNFSRFGGLVIGNFNEISGDFAAVSGGLSNTASGEGATVSGGNANTASGQTSSVSGGFNNTASGQGATISGGDSHVASGSNSSVSGGLANTASGMASSVSGGFNNTASAESAAISGGRNITHETESGWAAGSEGAEIFVGNFRSP
jgi:hypothetical protein